MIDNKTEREISKNLWAKEIYESKINTKNALKELLVATKMLERDNEVLMDKIDFLVAENKIILNLLSEGTTEDIGKGWKRVKEKRLEK